MARCLAAAISHAPGLSGTPDCGHCSSATTRASCARSSATPTSRTIRANPAMSLGDSIRQTASIASCVSVPGIANHHTILMSKQVTIRSTIRRPTRTEDAAKFALFRESKSICIYIYCGMSKRFPGLPCMCSSIRRASRAMTQLYEDALRPLGLRATQFTILQVLSRAGEVSQGHLGEMLAMDSTSLTRTLGIMRREGWIAERRGEDRRERWLRLAKTGEARLSRALPVWEKTHSELR